MARRIIHEQSLIIGPIAWEEANKVTGLHALEDGDTLQIEETSKAKDVLDELVGRYQRLFGQTSVDVCKSAVSDVTAGMSKQEIPKMLQE